MRAGRALASIDSLIGLQNSRIGFRGQKSEDRGQKSEALEFGMRNAECGILGDRGIGIRNWECGIWKARAKGIEQRA